MSRRRSTSRTEIAPRRTSGGGRRNRMTSWSRSPFPASEAGLYGTEYPFRGTPQPILGVMTIDDKWGGRRYLVTPRIIRGLQRLFHAQSGTGPRARGEGEAPAIPARHGRHLAADQGSRLKAHEKIMTRSVFRNVGIVAVGVAVMAAAATFSNVGAQAQSGRKMPVFEVDPSWPKLPNNWLMGH